SSDVCSSDLIQSLVREPEHAEVAQTKRLGRLTRVLGLAYAAGRIPQRLPLARDRTVNLGPRPCVQREGATATEHLIVGVGGDHEDASRRRHRRYARTISRTASITSATS